MPVPPNRSSTLALKVQSRDMCTSAVDTRDRARRGPPADIHGHAGLGGVIGWDLLSGAVDVGGTRCAAKRHVCAIVPLDGTATESVLGCI
jgi:hypothetical protein